MKKYWLLFLFIVAISYGQLFFMQPWQDDNALMFKLAHIQEPAGYLGKGILGEGAYKYTATFYYPLYLLFGYNKYAFFGLSFVLYFLSVISVYYIAQKIFDIKSGILAGFLYACGYIASDGYIRLYNSVLTSLSVIILSFLTFFLWRLSKRINLKDYLMSFFLFFLAIESVRSRTHYLIAIPIFFEILFLTFKKPIIKNISYSILRLIPFLYIFYIYFLKSPDVRSMQVFTFFNSLFTGNVEVIYGFLGSLTNLFSPEWLYVYILPLVLMIIYLYLSLGYKKILVLGFISTFAVLKLITLTEPNHVFIGGAIIIFLVFLIPIIEKRKRNWYLLFLFWVLINIFAYSIYNPTEVYGGINRYLAHSFFALVFLFTLIPQKKFVTALIIIWGFGNLFSSYNLQNKILKNRSYPVEKFYSQMRLLMPKINKGQIVYIDVAENMKGVFAEAFSVAQMPEETALAWRYGIDRYDFKLITEPSDFVKYRAENMNDDNISSFFLSKDGLVRTDYLAESSIYTGLFNEQESDSNITTDESVTLIKKVELDIPLNNPIKSILPINITIKLLANPFDEKLISFPLIYNEMGPVNFKDFNELSDIYLYKKIKDLFRTNASIKSSSQWNKDSADKLLDSNYSSYWQGDRILWPDERTSLEINPQSNIEYNALVLVNVFPFRIPIEEKIYQKGKLLSFEKNIRNFQSGQFVIYEFKKTMRGSIKIEFDKTQNNDSPVFSEAWLSYLPLGKFEIGNAENFLRIPFSIVEDKSIYNYILAKANYTGQAQVWWKGDKNEKWDSSQDGVFDLVYDGQIREYKVTVHPAGTKIDSLKVVLNQIPGKMKFYSINIKQ